MDFTDLANSVKEYMNPGSTAVRDPHDPSTTYGPAQSRYTRMNQEFYSNPKDTSLSGQTVYAPNNVLARMLPGLAAKSAERINVSSPDTTSVKGTLRHEDTHALLGQLPLETLQDMASNNPYQEQVDRGLSTANRTGRASEEAPAYMAEGDPKATYGVPSAIRNLYIAHLTNQLGAINPSIARKYGQLSGTGQ